VQCSKCGAFIAISTATAIGYCIRRGLPCSLGFGWRVWSLTGTSLKPAARMRISTKTRVLLVAATCSCTNPNNPTVNVD
jgi:hypothetical protein